MERPNGMLQAEFLGWRWKAGRTNPRHSVEHVRARRALALRVRPLAVSLAALALLATAGTAGGQIVRPQISGPAKNAYEQLHPPSALDQVRQQATQPSPPLPLPPQPSERWVPDRRVYEPQLGREIVVPGHYERRVSDQQYAVPSLPAYDPSTGATITIPGGERPPADLRQGP
jgi:hypothetical protein